MTRTRPLQLVVLSASLALAACGGGGGGSSAIVGLLPPEQISVVTPVDESPLPPAAVFPPDSDYEQAVQSVHVYDPAIEPLGMVNEILCLVGQTGADQLVNEGPYLAQVNATMCSNGQGGDDTEQASNSVDEFQLWTVDSTRASNAAAQDVNYWIPEEENGSPLTIFVDMELTQGVDETHPFGEFALDFAGAPDAANLDDPVFNGALSARRLPSGLSGFDLFFDKGDVSQVPAPGDESEETAATVAIDEDQLGGAARIRQRRRSDFGSGDSGILTSEYLVAYDETHFLRALDGGAPEAFHRLQFIENVWRYDLFDATSGDRIERDSGFGFRTASGDYGWIGYWGMWAPEGVTVASGDTITRDEFGSAGQDYTVFKAPGKLIRNTRHTLALEDLAGRTFNWWWISPISGAANYVVEYRVQAGHWVVTGSQEQGASTVTPIVPPQVVDIASIGFLSMWSQSLGGQTTYVYGDAFVTYYAQEFVDGDDPVFAGGDLPLFGLVQCLRPGSTAVEAEVGDVYLPDAPDVAGCHTFLFQQSDLTLYLDTTGTGGGLDRVGLADGEHPTTGPCVWGMRSGPLVTTTAGLTNIWDVWSVPEFYVWETGANDWNQFTRVTDSNGAFVEFDPPLSFSYVQQAGDDRNGDDALAGQTFLLNYGGPGQLWGLPQHGVDLDGDDQPDRWYPEVNLADGTLVGPNGTEYVVKAREIEQRLAPDPAYVGPLDLSGASALTVPDETIYTTPAIGPAPEVTDPPRVVQGVVGGGP